MQERLGIVLWLDTRPTRLYGLLATLEGIKYLFYFDRVKQPQLGTLCWFTVGEPDTTNAFDNRNGYQIANIRTVGLEEEISSQDLNTFQKHFDQAAKEYRAKRAAVVAKKLSNPRYPRYPRYPDGINAYPKRFED